MREWGQGSAQVQKITFYKTLVQFQPPGNYIFQGSTVSKHTFKYLLLGYLSFQLIIVLFKPSKNMLKHINLKEVQIMGIQNKKTLNTTA